LITTRVRSCAGLLLTLTLAGCSLGPEPADLVLVGGRIVTLDPDRPEATGLAARAGRIVAVGSDQQAKAFVGPRTEVIRLNGMLAVPGLIESHGHLLKLGILRMNLDLAKTRSWEEVVAQVREAAATAKPGAWIFGRGWHQEKWDHAPPRTVEGYPTPESLDQAAPANPVLLAHASGHAVFANAAALRATGIDDKTKDPSGGRIVRDDAGHATGALLETAADLAESAMDDALARRTPAEIDADTARAVDLAQDECLRKGITTFQDAGETFATIDRLRKMAADGRLRMRLWVMVRDTNALLRERLPAYRLIGTGNGFLTVRAIKRQIDGALGSRGAWLLAPYADDATSSGYNTEPVEGIEETAQLAIENGFQLCVHAIGDRANRETLDLFERTFRAHPDKRDLRWRIEHAQHLSRADLPRFHELGVIASMQGIHCTSDGPWVPTRIGLLRAEEGAYLWRDLIDSGAIVCNGTDVPVEDVDPIANFKASVTRQLPVGSAFYPKQKMTRFEALRSYTANAAYAAFEEDVIGTLSVGKLADVTVLTRDILLIPGDEIEHAKVAYTIVGGRVVFRGDARTR
jgi:predicted amidohydrolase YtcJ